MSRLQIATGHQSHGAVALALCAAFAGCAATETEPSATTREAVATLLPPKLPLGVSNVSADATEGSVTVRYDRPRLMNAAAVTLRASAWSQTSRETTSSNAALTTGLGGTASSAGYAVTFAGLRKCTSYSYAIAVDGTVYANGTIHTVAVGGAPCALDEIRNPSDEATFLGIHHVRGDHDWCSRDAWKEAYRIYPLGTAWRSRQNLQPLNAPGGVRAGFVHYYDGGEDPFPCSESYVEADRGWVEFAIDPDRVADVRRAVATMDVKSWIDGHESAGLCVSELSMVGEQNYASTREIFFALNDYGEHWDQVLGTMNWWGLERHWSLAIPIQAANGRATADVTARVSPDAMRFGFAAPNDGFGSLIMPSPSFAEDNAACVTDFQNVQLHVEYAPPLPNTPMHCAATIRCGIVYFSCDGQAEAFTLHRVNADGGDYVVAWAPGTNGTPVELSDGANAWATAQRYYVCAENASGASCSQSIVATPSGDACGGGGGGGGGRRSPGKVPTTSD